MKTVLYSFCCALFSVCSYAVSGDGTFYLHASFADGDWYDSGTRLQFVLAPVGYSMPIPEGNSIPDGFLASQFGAGPPYNIANVPDGCTLVASYQLLPGDGSTSVGAGYVGIGGEILSIPYDQWTMSGGIFWRLVNEHGDVPISWSSGNSYTYNNGLITGSGGSLVNILNSPAPSSVLVRFGDGSSGGSSGLGSFVDSLSDNVSGWAAFDSGSVLSVFAAILLVLLAFSGIVWAVVYFRKSARLQ